MRAGWSETLSNINNVFSLCGLNYALVDNFLFLLFSLVYSALGSKAMIKKSKGNLMDWLGVGDVETRLIDHGQDLHP